MIRGFFRWLFPTSPARVPSSAPEPVKKYAPQRIKPPSALDVPTPRRRPVKPSPTRPAVQRVDRTPTKPRRSSVDDDGAAALLGVAVAVASMDFGSSDSSSSDSSSSDSSSSDFSGGGGDFGGGGADSTW